MNMPITRSTSFGASTSNTGPSGVSEKAKPDDFEAFFIVSSPVEQPRSKDHLVEKSVRPSRDEIELSSVPDQRSTSETAAFMTARQSAGSPDVEGLDGKVKQPELSTTSQDPQNGIAQISQLDQPAKLAGKGVTVTEPTTAVRQNFITPADQQARTTFPIWAEDLSQPPTDLPTEFEMRLLRKSLRSESGPLKPANIGITSTDPSTNIDVPSLHDLAAVISNSDAASARENNIGPGSPEFMAARDWADTFAASQRSAITTFTQVRELVFGEKPDVTAIDHAGSEGLSLDPAAGTSAGVREAAGTMAGSVNGTPRSDAAVLSQIDGRLIQLANSLRSNGDRNVLKMRLHPAELGSVEITVVRHRSGSVTTSIAAEREHTSSTLSENVSQLRDSLEKAGLLVEKIEVDLRPSSSSTMGQGEKHEASSGGRAEAHQPVVIDDHDGISDVKDVSQDRLVSLRA